jgi:lysozyme family protein
MTAFFRNRVIPFLWEWEGTTFENDPDDPGGATKYGIDQRSHPTVKIRDLTEEQAIEIYWSEWLKDGCDHLPQPLNWVFFDTAVNLGIGRANEFLKKSNGDINKYIDLRIAKYKSIGQNNPRSAKYVKGWVNRAEDLRNQVQRNS